jgi:hypothetical protein
MWGQTLLADPERRERIEHRDRRFLVGSSVVKSIEDMAMEIDEAHEGWRV